MALPISIEALIRQQIVENTFSGNTKGGLYETAIANVLYKKGYETFFYKNDIQLYLFS